MEKLHLYLVRHCESLGNRENIFQGQLDLDISATGEKQLALLALRFRNISIDAVYSSPLKRAYKTAEAVDLYHSLPIIKLPELMEVDVGALSGMKLDKAFADYPVFAEKWQNSPQNCIFPEGETTAEVYDRAKKALARVKADCMGKTAVITSHGFLLRCMTCEILEHDIERLSDIRIGGNTSVSEFYIGKDGSVETVRLSDNSHLPKELLGDPNQYVVHK